MDESLKESQENTEQMSTNDPLTVTKKRSVRFGDGDQLITAIFQPHGPWENVERLNPYELVGAYKIRCENDGTEPLYSVLSQLQDIDMKNSYTRRPHFALKGTQLRAADIEILEEVFKRVQFEHLNLENTNLDDDSLNALCEMLEFYETCTELCLARNTRIHSGGWKSLTRLVRKLPSLRWLDLRGVTLTNPDILLLAQAIRSQAVSCRAELSRFLKFRLANHRLLSKQKNGSESENVDPEEEKAATCVQHGATQCAKCLSESPYTGLQGIHLGSIGLKQLNWNPLASCIRLSSVCDLRLPDNQLGPQEALMLAPLIRYGASLRYLDLSKNRLGPEGCAHLAEALASTSFPSQTNMSAGLRRLDLSENDLNPVCMSNLASALPHCQKLTCLQLSGNNKLGCKGVVNLQPGLLACRRLTHLGLASCHIECIGAVALAEVLVDKPRCLSVIDLRWNKIGAAGLLAFARCVQCTDKRIRIEGLQQWEHDSSGVPNTDRIFQTAAKLAGNAAPPQTPPPVDAFLEEVRNNFTHFQELNLKRFPKSSSTSTRYCQILCPQNPPDKQTSKSPCAEVSEDNDPRYMWGDSSEDEDQELDRVLATLTIDENNSYNSRSMEDAPQLPDSPTNIVSELFTDWPNGNHAEPDANGKHNDRQCSLEASDESKPSCSNGSQNGHWPDAIVQEPDNRTETESNGAVPLH